MRSYVETYIKEEIEIEAQVRNLGSFLRFLPIAAAQNGEITNFSNIARECSIKNNTVFEYYKILEDTLIGFFLLPYNKSIRKKLTKHPKFYFFDTGVVSALNRRLTIPLDNVDSEYGKYFEHFFICELIRLNEYKRRDIQFSFYRTEKGAEVDVILEFPNGNSPGRTILESVFTLILACWRCRRWLGWHYLDLKYPEGGENFIHFQHLLKIAFMVKISLDAILVSLYSIFSADAERWFYNENKAR